jgi:hypothetical protein
MVTAALLHTVSTSHVLTTVCCAGWAGVVWWTGELAWSVLLDAWSLFVWDTTLTPKVCPGWSETVELC